MLVKLVHSLYSNLDTCIQDGQMFNINVVKRRIFTRGKNWILSLRHYFTCIGAYKLSKHDTQDTRTTCQDGNTKIFAQNQFQVNKKFKAKSELIKT